MKKAKSEKEIQFEAKMKELEKKEKATKKENKVKYGPGRRGVLIIVTTVLCIGIAILGVYFVQQLLKDDKYTGGNEVVTTVTTTTTALSVPTGAGTTTPVEIYPEDGEIELDDLDGDGIPNDEDPTPNGSSSDAMLDGGFGYDPIETPATSATTTVSEHNVQMTTDGNDIYTDGMGGGGDNNEEVYIPPIYTNGTTANTVTPSSSQTPQGSTASNSPTTTASSRPTNTTSNRPTTTTEKTTAITPIYTTNGATTSISFHMPVMGGDAYVDPEETRGHNAHDYLE